LPAGALRSADPGGPTALDSLLGGVILSRRDGSTARVHPIAPGSKPFRFRRRKEAMMGLSVRNQLTGTVKSIVLGAVMAEVVLDVDGVEIVSVVTRHSVEEMGIAAGDSVTALVEATDVMPQA
jgi:molybdopterin-binding protein